MTNPADETPKPPATAEFGAVEPNGAIHRYPATSTLEVSKRSVGGFDNNVYLIRCVRTNEALLIDGAAEPVLIEDLIGDASLVGIAQTHGHWDHIQALDSLTTGAFAGFPVHASPGDEYPVPTTALTDAQILEVGDLRVTVWHRPGHTPGSTLYLVDGFLFSGDTLFPGGPGNTFGDPAAFVTIMESLDRIFADVSDETRICPGHGLDSTIDRERPFIETWRRRGW